MIIGIGTDIVKVVRIKRILNSNQSDRFCKKIFSSLEIEYAFKRNYPHEHLAGFFTIKESFVKALSLIGRKAFRLKEIQVLHADTGAPYLKLEGAAKKYFEKLNAIKAHISISHDSDYASGIVIIDG